MTVRADLTTIPVRLGNTATPTNNDEAANKEYVDDQVSAGSGNKTTVNGTPSGNNPVNVNSGEDATNSPTPTGHVPVTFRSVVGTDSDQTIQSYASVASDNRYDLAVGSSVRFERIINGLETELTGNVLPPLITIPAASRSVNGNNHEVFVIPSDIDAEDEFSFEDKVIVRPNGSNRIYIGDIRTVNGGTNAIDVRLFFRQGDDGDDIISEAAADFEVLALDEAYTDADEYYIWELGDVRAAERVFTNGFLYAGISGTAVPTGQGQVSVRTDSVFIHPLDNAGNDHTPTLDSLRRGNVIRVVAGGETFDKFIAGITAPSGSIDYWQFITDDSQTVLEGQTASLRFDSIVTGINVKEDGTRVGNVSGTELNFTGHVGVTGNEALKTVNIESDPGKVDTDLQNIATLTAQEQQNARTSIGAGTVTDEPAIINNAGTPELPSDVTLEELQNLLHIPSQNAGSLHFLAEVDTDTGSDVQQAFPTLNAIYANPNNPHIAVGSIITDAGDGTGGQWEVTQNSPAVTSGGTFSYLVLTAQDGTTGLPTVGNSIFTVANEDLVVGEVQAGENITLDVAIPVDRPVVTINADTQVQPYPRVEDLQDYSSHNAGTLLNDLRDAMARAGTTNVPNPTRFDFVDTVGHSDKLIEFAAVSDADQRAAILALEVGQVLMITHSGGVTTIRVLRVDTVDPDTFGYDVYFNLVGSDSTTSIDAMTVTTVTTGAHDGPNDNDVLTYDSTTQAWHPAAPTGGTGGGTGGGLMTTRPESGGSFTNTGLLFSTGPTLTTGQNATNYDVSGDPNNFWGAVTNAGQVTVGAEVVVFDVTVVDNNTITVSNVIVTGGDGSINTGGQQIFAGTRGAAAQELTLTTLEWDTDRFEITDDTDVTDVTFRLLGGSGGSGDTPAIRVSNDEPVLNSAVSRSEMLNLLQVDGALNAGKRTQFDDDGVEYVGGLFPIGTGNHLLNFDTIHEITGVQIYIDSFGVRAGDYIQVEFPQGIITYRVTGDTTGGDIELSDPIAYQRYDGVIADVPVGTTGAGGEFPANINGVRFAKVFGAVPITHSMKLGLFFGTKGADLTGQTVTDGTTTANDQTVEQYTTGRTTWYYFGALRINANGFLETDDTNGALGMWSNHTDPFAAGTLTFNFEG